MRSVLKKSCKSMALSLLSVRDYSTAKLTKKLLEKEYPSEEVVETIRWLTDLSYLSDTRYIRSRIKGLARKGYSSYAIQERLKGEDQSLLTSQEEILTILREEGIEKEEILQKVVEKKLKGKTELSLKEYSKLVRYLIGKGYRYDEIKKVVPSKNMMA